MNIHKWQFYVESPKGEMFGQLLFDRQNADVFEGTEDEARKHLSEKINKTWSPYVFYNFEIIEENNICDDCDPIDSPSCNKCVGS